jgi:drug/metabolite transporter (DMT)-like permease
MSSTIALLGRVFLSASASTLQKKLTLGGVETIALWRSTYSWMAIPAAAVLAMTWKQVPAPFWHNAIAAGLLDALGNLAMVAALRSTDLSIFGPLNGFRPVLALLFGWVFLGEQASFLGSVGVATTVVGVALLLREEDRSAPTTTAWRVLVLRATGLSLATFAAVFLKRATLLGSAGMTLGVWIFCGLGVFGLFSLRSASRTGNAVVGARALLAGHAAVFFVMQWLTLEVFRFTLLAYSFALFQLGMVLQVLIGHWLFHEPHFRRRLACCGIIGAGALLVSSANPNDAKHFKPGRIPSPQILPD